MRTLRQLVGPFFVFAGVMHFVIPGTYRKIVPPINAEDFPAIPGGAVSLWARLPFQGVFIAWILDAMRGR
jgi:hypothetical protein